MLRKKDERALGKRSVKRIEDKVITNEDNLYADQTVRKQKEESVLVREPDAGGESIQDIGNGRSEQIQDLNEVSMMGI